MDTQQQIQRSDFIGAVTRKSGVSRGEAARVYLAMMELLGASLREKHHAHLPGFATIQWGTANPEGARFNFVRSFFQTLTGGNK